MATHPEIAMTCPVCLDIMKKPIRQCKIGHSMCGDCITNNHVKRCPECRGQLTETRNYRLEELIEGVRNCLKLPCCYSINGCKYTLTANEKETHQNECKYRLFSCEGNKFGKWKCEWYGKFEQIYQHFKTLHPNNVGMEWKTEATCTINFNEDYYDLQIIPFFNGLQLFWYKHKVDITKKMVYWTIQFIGPINYAKHYYYEFEVDNGPISKFKVTQICENDVCKEDEIFDEERCVVMSFKTVKRFLNESGDLQFKFRIMVIKGPNSNTSNMPATVSQVFSHAYFLNKMNNQRPESKGRIVINKSKKQPINNLRLHH